MRPTKNQLLIWAGAVSAIGAALAIWFGMSGKPPAPHPETARFKQIAESRVVLADAFRSYDSETAVATMLEAAGLTVRRKVQQRPDDPRYPLRRMTSFTVDNYRHLDSDGTLVLEFFNDRLMEADFRPDEPARYAPRLHRAIPALRVDRTGHAEAVEGDLRIWGTVDLAKSKVGRTLGSDGVVLWQDLRLISERDDWDARFGSIPIPTN